MNSLTYSVAFPGHLQMSDRGHMDARDQRAEQWDLMLIKMI